MLELMEDLNRNSTNTSKNKEEIEKDSLGGKTERIKETVIRNNQGSLNVERLR